MKLGKFGLQSGMGLLEVMIASGIASGLMLAVTQSMTNNAQNSKRMTLSNQWSNVVATIRRAYTDVNVCTATFTQPAIFAGGHSASYNEPSEGVAGIPLSTLAAYNPSSAGTGTGAIMGTFLTTGKNVGGYQTISITLKQYPGSTRSLVTLATGTTTTSVYRNRVYLQIYAKKIVKAPNPGPTPSATPVPMVADLVSGASIADPDIIAFNLYTLADSTNSIYQCTGDMAGCSDIDQDSAWLTNPNSGTHVNHNHKSCQIRMINLNSQSANSSSGIIFGDRYAANSASGTNPGMITYDSITDDNVNHILNLTANSVIVNSGLLRIGALSGGDQGLSVLAGGSANGVNAIGAFPGWNSNNYLYLNTFSKGGAMSQTFSGGVQITGDTYVSGGAVIGGGAGTSNSSKLDIKGSAHAYGNFIADGNIGIGTPTASYPLHISAGGGTIATFMNTSSGMSGFQFLSSNGSGTSYLGDIGTNNSIGFNAGSNFISLWTNKQERIRISSDGTVGIGTKTPDSALTVSSPSATFHLQQTGAANTTDGWITQAEGRLTVTSRDEVDIGTNTGVSQLQVTASAVNVKGALSATVDGKKMYGVVVNNCAVSTCIDGGEVVSYENLIDAGNGVWGCVCSANFVPISGWTDCQVEGVYLDQMGVLTQNNQSFWAASCTNKKPPRNLSAYCCSISSGSVAYTSGITDAGKCGIACLNNGGTPQDSKHNDCSDNVNQYSECNMKSYTYSGCTLSNSGKCGVTCMTNGGTCRDSNGNDCSGNVNNYSRCDMGSYGFSGCSVSQTGTCGLNCITAGGTCQDSSGNNCKNDVNSFSLCNRGSYGYSGCSRPSTAYNCLNIGSCADSNGKSCNSNLNNFLSCRVTGSSCPSGWRQLDNWSTTLPENCNGSGTFPPCLNFDAKCNTGFHGQTNPSPHWMENKARDSCKYTNYKSYLVDCTETDKTCWSTITDVGCVPN